MDEINNEIVSVKEVIIHAISIQDQGKFVLNKAIKIIPFNSLFRFLPYKFWEC